MKFLCLLSAFAVFFVVESQESGWSEWTDKPGEACDDTCGACGGLKQIRTCQTANGCLGANEQIVACNLEVCTFPRPLCCSGYSPEVKDSKRICTEKP
ncbi:unnamed protein product [Caenorhabditis auriculariae]|uniref:Uncharacterized protein n=1 Tax=Caenorhabditis auriculariae TaxID=2777116 RepID=A0A8S1HV37_9PELO|nr:unnamed protein product [Caenorhabditis auriculariae]